MLAVVFVTLDDNRNRSVIYIDTEGAFDANRYHIWWNEGYIAFKSFTFTSISVDLILQTC